MLVDMYNNNITTYNLISVAQNEDGYSKKNHQIKTRLKSKDSYFSYMLCLVPFLNRKGKTFSEYDHSHFDRA